VPDTPEDRAFRRRVYLGASGQRPEPLPLAEPLPGVRWALAAVVALALAAIGTTVALVVLGVQGRLGHW